MTLFLVRWGIPGLVILGGLVAFAVNPSMVNAEGAAGVIGAGLAWILFSLLYRQGEQGDHERDVEEAAREYLDEHGRWPTDEQYATFQRHGRWTLPPSAA